MPKVKDLSILMTRKDLANEDLSQLNFAPGFVIADRYECVELIGAGGMGAVYLVKDHMLENELIALKVLLPKFVGDEEAKKRFRKEVAISRKIFHSNVLRTYDLGNFESLDFFTMEYVPGQNLREWMKERQTKEEVIPLHQVADILVGILDGLECAHKLTVHCDIKPDNILLCENQKIKICDFGISRVQTNQQITYTNHVMGTYNYIAPEIQQNGKVDARIDLYSVGVICYEMLTGKMPIGRFELPRQINSQLSEKIDLFIEKALAYEPEKRFQTAEEMNEALQDFVSPDNKSPKRIKKEVEQLLQEQKEELAILKEKLDVRGKKLADLVARQHLLQGALHEKETALEEKEKELQQKTVIIEKQKKDLERKNKQVQEKQIALEDIDKMLKKKKEQIEQELQNKEKGFRSEVETVRKLLEKEKRELENEKQRAMEETSKIVFSEKKAVSLFETARISLKSFSILKKEKAPFDTTLWNLCWQAQHEYFNFAHTSWLKLPCTKQQKYSKIYQKWYAQRHSLNIEQIFIAGKIRVSMMLIPPGIFWMGAEDENGNDNEKPRHKVNISQAFWMAKFPISQYQWISITGTKPWEEKKYAENQSESPVNYVSWNNLNENFLKPLGQKFKLPSESQWEYACRSGVTYPYFWGEDQNRIGDYAWYSANKKKNAAHLVGLKKSNTWGLYDMNGNIWEWCEDTWSENYHKVPVDSSSNMTKSSSRVRRGGSYWSFAQDNRSACRTPNRSDNCWDDLGFRIIRKVK